MAPIMALEGHPGEIYSVKFHPEGGHLASAGYDRQICTSTPLIYAELSGVMICLATSIYYQFNRSSLVIVVWNVYGECENIGTLSGHTGAIMELHFTTDGNYIITCSTDTSLGMWDLDRGQRVKKLKGT